MNSKGPGARPWIRRAPINIAVTGSPGIPKVIIGIRAPPVTALLADSGAAMPWGDPLPKLSGLTLSRLTIVVTNKSGNWTARAR